MSKQKQIINRIKTLIKEYKSLNESVNEDYASRTVALIADLTGTNKKFIQGFIDKHNLDVEKLYQYLKKGKYTERMDFVTAVAGKDGNPIQKKIIKMFSKSVNEASGDFGGWIAFYNDKKLEISKSEANSLYAAKQLAIKKLKVPKSKMGLLAIQPAVEESVNEGKFKVDDLVYNKRTKTVGIVRMGDDKYGEVKTDADGNVSVDELEKYNPIKFKHQTKAKVAPSTEKEVNSRGLFNPFKSESVNEDEQLDEKLITFSNRAPYGQVVFMAGGAGSGKGFAISNFIDSAGFKVRDVDEMKTQVGKLEQIGKINIDSWYKKFSGNLAPEEREHVEKWVINKGLTISDIASDLKNPNNVASLHYIVDSMGIKDKWLTNMLAGKSNPETLPNLIFDITAKNIKSITKVIQPLLNQGYKSENIHLVWVLTNYHIAVKQNKSRARIVPDDILLLTHEGAAKTIWSIVNGALPRGLNGRIDVILGGAKNTVMYTDSNGNELKGAVKGFTTLPVKKQGGGILPEKQWLNILYKWVSDNTPKTISLQKPLDLQMESLKEALKKKSVNEAKLSPSKQKELDALIDEFKQATDPENEYIDGGYGRYRDENEILRDIEKKFGKTIASQVSAISHYPRHDISRDKLAFKQQWYGQPKRITKKGKMHKQDIQKMKNYYRGY